MRESDPQSIFQAVSPTIHREGSYRFFFFSREEARPHVHVVGQDGEAKFWLDPIVALSNYTGLDVRQLRQIQTIVEEHQDDFRNSWHQHFST